MGQSVIFERLGQGAAVAAGLTGTAVILYGLAPRHAPPALLKKAQK